MYIFILQRYLRLVYRICLFLFTDIIGHCWNQDIYNGT